MAIYLHQKLKEYRKARDLTQEQIADIFNVSPQTVSRWETGTNLPDIELLPALAEYFSVTADELLGSDTAKRKKEIRRYSDEIHEKFRGGLTDEAIEICRDAVREFPNEYSLLSWLATNLNMKSSEVSNEEKEEYLNESISVCERILEYCRDDAIRFNALQILAGNYKDIGNREKALEIADNLPFYSSCIMRWGILEGEEKLSQGVLNFLTYTAFLDEQIETLTGVKSNADLLKRIVDIAYRGWANAPSEGCPTHETWEYKEISAEIRKHMQL